MQAVIPQLTRFRQIQPISPGGVTAVSTDGIIEGGSMAAANGTNRFFALGSMFQTPKTGKWAAVFAIHFRVSSGSNQVQVGLQNLTAPTHTLNWNVLTNTDATHAYMRYFDGTTANILCTGNVFSTAIYQNIMLTGDGTNISMYVNNVLACQAAVTGITNGDEPMVPYMFNTASGDITVLDVAVGFVAPTFGFNNDSVLQPNWAGITENAMPFTEMPGSISAGMTSTLQAVEYQRLKDGGAKALRAWVGIEWFYPNWPSLTGGPAWTSTRMLALYDWIAKAQANGQEVDITPLWLYPDDICSPSTFNGCTPTPAQETNTFAAISALDNQLINVEGFTNVKGNVLFTEPNQGHTANIPVPFNPESYYLHIAQGVSAQIVTDDAGRTPIRPRIKIIGTEEQQATTPVWTNYMVANGPGTFDRYHAHNYCIRSAFAPYGITAATCPARGALVAEWQSWISGLSGVPMWSDEINVIGSSTFDQYRFTGDEGLVVARLIDAHMNSGLQASQVWLSQDYETNVELIGSQHYGMSRFYPTSLNPYPAWYAYSMIANLTGGGSGTQIFTTNGNSDAFHGTGVLVPSGVGACAIPGGCYTFVVINEASAPSSASWAFARPIQAQTIYRYVYNGGNVPRPTPEKPAYRVPYDMVFPSVSLTVPANVVPAHSIAVYSSINLSAPVSVSLSPSATVVASSVGSGSAASIADGDTTHLSIAAAGWEPNSGAVGTQTAEEDWPTPVTVNRIELDFAGSSDPLYWADYATLAHPSVLSAYTVQYWNGVSFVDFSPAINVSGNVEIHRTHTFASVSTTKIRIAVAQGTTAPVNEMAVFGDPACSDCTALGLYAWTDPASASGDIVSKQISATNYTFQSGDVISYDVLLLDQLTSAPGVVDKAGTGGIDVTVDAGCTGAFSAQGSAWQDQNAILGAPTADLTQQAYGQWYHRTLAVPACAVGHVSQSWMVVQQRSDRQCTSQDIGCTSATYYGSGATAFYRNIIVTHSGGATAATIYGGGAPASVTNVSQTGMLTGDIFVAPRAMS